MFPFDLSLFLQCQHWQMHALLSPFSCHSYGLYLTVHHFSRGQMLPLDLSLSYTFSCMGSNKIPDKLSSTSPTVFGGCSASSKCTLEGDRYSKSFYSFAKTVFTDQNPCFYSIFCGPRTVCP